MALVAREARHLGRVNLTSSFTRQAIIDLREFNNEAYHSHLQTPALCAPEAKMAAMFSQNPLMNGPNYSFNQTPTTAAGGNKEHSFYPYDDLEAFVLSTLLTLFLDTPTTAVRPLRSPASTSPLSQVTLDPHLVTTLTPATLPKSSKLVAQPPLKKMQLSFYLSLGSQQMERP